MEWGSPSYWGYSMDVGYNATELNGNVDDATGRAITANDG
jgi:hypothetical protein